MSFNSVPDADLGLSANDTSPLMQLFPEHSCNRDLLKAVLTEKDTLAPPMWNRKDTELMQVLATPLTKLCARSVSLSVVQRRLSDCKLLLHVEETSSLVVDVCTCIMHLERNLSKVFIFSL